MEKRAKYRLIKDSGPDDPVTVRIALDAEGASLDELCALFEQYLRASGFHFQGHIDIVQSEDLLKESQAW